jgi:hypothetical protein
MLKELNGDQACFIGLLAKAARMQRDVLIDHITEDDLGGTEPVRGKHNPTSRLGFAPLTPDSGQLKDLSDAISTLTPPAPVELYGSMRIDQGRIAVKTWYRGISDANVLDEVAIVGALADDPDLHDHL